MLGMIAPRVCAAAVLPVAVKAAVEAEFGLGSTAGTRHTVEVLTLTGVEIHTVKGFGAKTGANVGGCYTAKGGKLFDCGQTLRKTERKVYYSDYGALDPEAWTTLTGTPLDERLPVLIWLFTQEPQVAREVLIENPIQAALHKANVAIVHAAAKVALQAAWSKVSATELTFLDGAPAAMAAVTPTEMMVLAKVPVVAGVHLRKPAIPQSTSYVDTLNADSTGYQATNQKVCVIERDQPPTPNGLDLVMQQCVNPTSDHSRCVVGVIGSSDAPNGTARASDKYVAAYNCSGDSSVAIAWCGTTAAADVWNFSNSCTTGTNRLLDYWVKASPFPLITVAAGNDNMTSQVGCPNACGAGAAAVTSCTGFNVLNVGGSNDCGDATRSNDLIYCKNSDLNPASTDRELLHLVAPAQDITAESLTCGSGTSFAAPMVAGIAAQLIDKNSAVADWPEVMRSILMTSATENVDGVRLDLLDAVDDRDGAGEVDAEVAVGLAAATCKVNGNNNPSELGHDYGTITAAGTPAGQFYSEQYRALTSSQSKRIRVVLSWDGTANCTDSADSTTCGATSLDADFDLEVFDGDGIQKGISNTTDNSYEFVEFEPDPDQTYTIKIKVWSWTATQTYFGLSWYITDYPS